MLNREEIINCVALSSYISDPEKLILKSCIEGRFCKTETKQNFCILSTRIKKNLYIVFQGTNDLKDVLYDIRFPMDTSSTIFRVYESAEVAVHKGFLDAYLLLRDLIREMIKEYSIGYNKLILTGHSMGGVLARLTTIDLQLNLEYLNPGCCVFGCPNMGNANFEFLFKDHVINFESYKNRSDIICSLPFRFLGFATHKRKKIKSTTSNPFTGFAFFGNWKDHLTDRYEEGIINYYTDTNNKG